MPLNQVINTRATDLESKGKLLNIAEATLANAASLSAHPVRKNEFDIEVARLDDAIASAHSLTAYVDTTNLTLADALADGAFDTDHWTFESTELRVGDMLILDAATEQDSDRAWLMIAANGDAGDFKALGSDIDTAIASAVNTAVSNLTGDATTFTNLGLVEDELESLSTAVSGKAETKEYSVSWGAADGEGISTATIDTSSDFGTKSVSVRVLKDLGDGYFEHISTSTLEVASNAASVRLRTDSASIISATLVVEVTGIPVV